MEKEATDLSNIVVSMTPAGRHSKASRQIKVSSRWEGLVEVEPPRPAEGDRPYASPVFRPLFGKEGAPSLGHDSLLDMFE